MGDGLLRVAAGASLNDVADTLDIAQSSPSELLRRAQDELIANALLAAVVSVLSFTIMPPPNVEWAVGLQLAIAAVVGVTIFAVTSGLLVVPELLRGGE